MNVSSALGQPVRLESPAGLSVQLNPNGSIRRMDYRDIVVNLFPGNELEGGPANLFLRRWNAKGEMTFTPLLGPAPLFIRSRQKDSRRPACGRE